MTADRTTPVVLVISDSLGDTARDVALAAAGQFDADAVEFARLPKVTAIGEVERFVAPIVAADGCACAFYTIASRDLRLQVSALMERLGIPAVDVLGPALDAIEHVTGREPRGIPGVIHRIDERYFKRIEAMEYFVEHDDGRGADDLADADIVLLGISRTGKTPLSMYLAHLGYRVANIPLVPGVEPPAAVFSLDPCRVFGLLSTADVVSSIRDARLGDDYARAVASDYADPEQVARELDDARALMRRLGCCTVRTDGKAIEESAAEIIGRIEEVERGRARRRTASGR